MQVHQCLQSSIGVSDLENFRYIGREYIDLHQTYYVCDQLDGKEVSGAKNENARIS